MSAKYWQRGEAIDYTATDALANGDAESANTPAGWAVAAAGSSDATVLVKLLG